MATIDTAMTDATQPLASNAEITCEVCNISFTQRRSLFRHQRGPAHAAKAQEPGFWFHCNEGDCSGKFSRYDHLLRHTNEVHGGLKRKASRTAFTRTRNQRSRTAAFNTASSTQPLEVVMDFDAQPHQYAVSVPMNCESKSDRPQGCQHSVGTSIRGMGSMRHPAACNIPASSALSNLTLSGAKTQDHMSHDCSYHLGAVLPEAVYPALDDSATTYSLQSRPCSTAFKADSQVLNQNGPVTLTDRARAVATPLNCDLNREADGLSLFRDACCVTDWKFVWKWHQNGSVDIPPRINLRNASKAGATQRPGKSLDISCSWCHKVLQGDADETLAHIGAHVSPLARGHRCSTCRRPFFEETDLKLHQTECKVKPEPGRGQEPSHIQWQRRQLQAYKEMAATVHRKRDEGAKRKCWSAIGKGIGPPSKSSHTTARMSLHSAPDHVLSSLLDSNSIREARLVLQTDAILTPNHDSQLLGDKLLRAVLSHDSRVVEALSSETGDLNCELGTVTAANIRLNLRPLTMAALLGDLHMTKQLLCLHASPGSFHSEDSCGTALWAAVYTKQYGIVIGLCKHQDLRRIPRRADSEWRDEPLGYFLPGVSRTRAMDVSVLDTGLAIAIHQGDPDMARILLKHGANPMVKIHIRLSDLGSVEMPALCYAAHIKNFSLLRLLLQQPGTTPDVTSNLGSALSIACGYGEVRSVLLLLHFRADPNISAGWRLTPLMEAAKVHAVDIIDFLVLFGRRHRMRNSFRSSRGREKAQINLQIKSHISDIAFTGSFAGPTALMIAAEYKQRNAVERLLQLGADVNICGGQYGSVIAAAAHADCEDTVDTLFTLGAATAVPCLECGGSCRKLTELLSRGSRERRLKEARKAKARARKQCEAMSVDYSMGYEEGIHETVASSDGLMCTESR